MATLDLTSYRAGLRQMLNTVWPEIDRDAGGGGIWTVPRIQLVALEDVRSDDAITTVAIIQQEPAAYTPEWGITNQSYEIPTMFHYVRRRDMDTDLEEFIEAKLLVLEQYLLYTGPTLGQCLAVTGLDVTEGNAANALLLDKNKAYFGGTLAARMLVGHTAE
jgi:hypothetical protein